MRHSREGSGGSVRSSSIKSGGQHSRQSSKDKTSSSQHSRQNSRELLTQLPASGISSTTDKPSKNIEIYATLPKKKVGGSYRGSKARTSNDNDHIVEDEEYILYDRPGRERGLYPGRTILGKKKDDERNAREKRARSEERNKNTKDYTQVLTSALTLPKDGKKEKGKVEDVPKKANGNSPGELKQGKKQHKIRRKLLMGGLIRRKNRSMPDLREGQESGECVGRNDGGMESSTIGAGMKASQDDSSVGLKGAGKSAGTGTLSGYLSEGHLEYTGGGNPNLERSKLMRKSFHGSAGKVLQIPKVPPPPPLRTTSQLSAKPDTSSRDSSGIERPQFPLPSETTSSHLAYSHFHRPGHITDGNKMPHNPSVSPCYNFEPQSLPYLPTYNSEKNHVQAINECLFQQRIQGDAVMYANGGILCDIRSQFLHGNQLVTQAEVHNEHNSSVPVYVCEQSSTEMEQDPPDKVASSSPTTLPLPPYPSPLNSVSHSRQVSEDFPPPPPPLDSAVATEAVNKLLVFGTEESFLQNSCSPSPQQQQTSPSSLLLQLQQKRQQILSKEVSVITKEMETEGTSSVKSGEEWLRELQAKQAERQLKKLQNGMADAVNRSGQHDNGASNSTNQDKKPSSVKDLASRFENIHLHKPQMPVCIAESEIRLAKTITGPALKVPVTNGVNGRVSPCLSQEQVTSTSQPPLSLNSSFDLSTNFLTNCPPNLRENRSDSVFDTGVLSVKKRNSASDSSVECLLSVGGSAMLEQKAHDIPLAAVTSEMRRETSSPGTLEVKEVRKKNIKKKNVTFCDQVILVATAEDEEEDNYIPNPILERVLRSAFHGKQESTQQLAEPHIEVRNLQGSEPRSEPTRSTMNVKEHSNHLQQQKLDLTQQPYQKVPLQPVHSTNQYNAAYQHVPQPIQHVQHQILHQTSHQHDPRSPYKPVHPDMLRTSSQLYHIPPPAVHPPYQHIPMPHLTYSSYTPQQNMYIQQQRNIPPQQHTTTNSHPEQQTHSVSATSLPACSDIIQIPPEYQHPPQHVHQPYYHHQQFTNSMSGLSNGHAVPYPQRQPMMSTATQQLNGHGTEPLSYLKQSQQSVPPYQHPPVRQTPLSLKGMQNQNSNKDAGRHLEKKPSPVTDNACHLCRKKQVVPPAVYCGDCDFYLSRFRPRN